MPATAQFIYQAHDLDKPEMIGRMLQAEGAGLTIIFTRTKRQAQRVADDLIERGFKASPLHGDMAQAAREKALTRFREGKIQVLVATDVAARGIDVTGRHPRHQLHLPRGREDLRPPDRPHRPGRCHRHRGHVRRLVGPAPLEDDQQGPRPAVRRADGDLLQLRALPPRHGHPARHQGPGRSPRARSSSPVSRARTTSGGRGGRGAGGGGRGARSEGGRSGGWRRRRPRPSAPSAPTPHQRRRQTSRPGSRNRNRRRTRGARDAARCRAGVGVAR